MDDNIKLKKKYLTRVFKRIKGEDIGLDEYESIQWFEQRGYSHEEAIQETLDKYRKVLLRNDDITDVIVRFSDIYELFTAIDEEGNEVIVEKDENEDSDQKYYQEYIDYLSGRFCNYDFELKVNKLEKGTDIILEKGEDIIKELQEVFIAYEIVKGLIRQREYIASQQHKYRNITDKAETKTDRLADHIVKYGFMDLRKVKDLPENNIPKLIELIAVNNVPYAIAMFDFLGFIRHLEANHFKTKDSLFKNVAKWLGRSERDIKGNILVLNEKSKEDRVRYTSCEYRKEVVIDFEKLK